MSVSLCMCTQRVNEPFGGVRHLSMGGGKAGMVHVSASTAR